MTRFTPVALAIGLVASACDGPTRPSSNPANAPAASPTPPPAVSTLQALAGSYDLAVNLSDQCTELPQSARQRTYRVTFEASPYGYLGVRVTGGGYSTPTVTGDLWSAGSAGVSIDWNNFDVGGCDGWPEQEPDGSQLMICGTGAGIPDDTGKISVPLRGSVLAEAATAGGYLSVSAFISSRSREGKPASSVGGVTHEGATVSVALATTSRRSGSCPGGCAPSTPRSARCRPIGSRRRPRPQSGRARSPARRGTPG